MEIQYIYELISLILLILVAVFAFYLPDRKKKRILNENINQIRKGDTVITKNGLKGKVVDANEETIIITLRPNNVRLEIAKWGVLQVNP